MPWKVTGVMDERLQFVSAYLREEDALAALCRAYGISRPTGYKWIARYQAAGVTGLVERSRAPHTHPQAVSAEVDATLLAARGAHPTWGPRKLVAWLGRTQPSLALPVANTVGTLLARAGLVVPRPHVRLPQYRPNGVRQRHHRPVNRFRDHPRPFGPRRPLRSPLPCTTARLRQRNHSSPLPAESYHLAVDSTGPSRKPRPVLPWRGAGYSTR